MCQITFNPLVTILALLLFVILPCCNGQLRILQPSELASRFPGSVIRGSTAAFGTPYWGEQLIGRLAYAPSERGLMYCNETDYSLPKLDDMKMETVGDLRASEQEEGEDVRHFPRIVVVRRGQCHFAQKVKVAQDSKEASAVVVVDTEGSGRSSDDIRSIIMADDGLGSRIRIPSVLISDEEGSLIINTLQSGQDVIAELVWDIPNDSIVSVDHWISPALSSSVNFLASFAPYAHALKHRIDFKPHYWIFSLPSDASEMCLDTSGRFCGMTPDWHDSEITGKQVVEESLRQICLWQTTKSINLTLTKSGEYSAIWWSYVEEMGDACLRPLPESPTYETRMTPDCSYNLMRKLGADLDRLDACLSSTGMSHLTSDLYNHAWSPTAMMINDARFAGPLDAFVVARAICTGFAREPPECALLKSRHIHDVLYQHPTPDPPYLLGETLALHRGGVAWWVYFLSVLASLAACIVVIAMYRYWLAKQLRNELRYEIFEEVKSQMGGGAGGPGGAQSRAPAFRISSREASFQEQQPQLPLQAPPMQQYRRSLPTNLEAGLGVGGADVSTMEPPPAAAVTNDLVSPFRSINSLGGASITSEGWRT